MNNIKKLSTMKKLILSIVVILISITSFSQIASKKKIIDYPHYIQIIDTAATNTDNAPYDIIKPFTMLKIMDGETGSEAVYIYTNKEDNANSQVIPDYKISYKELNDFADQQALIDYLEEIAVGVPSFPGYTAHYMYDANSNVDTIYYVAPSINDTSFYWWGDWAGTLIDSSGFDQH